MIVTIFKTSIVFLLAPEIHQHRNLTLTIMNAVPKSVSDVIPPVNTLLTNLGGLSFTSLTPMCTCSKELSLESNLETFDGWWKQSSDAWTTRLQFILSSLSRVSVAESWWVKMSSLNRPRWSPPITWIEWLFCVKCL